LAIRPSVGERGLENGRGERQQDPLTEKDGILLTCTLL
jgi:hypothetical protein